MLINPSHRTPSTTGQETTPVSWNNKTISPKSTSALPQDLQDKIAQHPQKAPSLQGRCKVLSNG